MGLNRWWFLDGSEMETGAPDQPGTPGGGRGKKNRGGKGRGPFNPGRGGGLGHGGGGGGGGLSFFAGDHATRPYATASTWPSSVQFSGKTYHGYTAETLPQAAKLKVLTHSTGAVTTHVIDSHLLENDDHGQISLEVLSDGRMVAAYGSHNSDQRWSISGQSGGVPVVTSWTRQTALTGSYTYPKFVNIDTGGGGGDLYIFLRSGSNVFGYRKATYTSGGAVSFGAFVSVCDFTTGGGIPYVSEVRKDSSNNIHAVMSREVATRENVYWFKLITSTAAWENLSGSFSTASGSLPITLAQADSNYKEFTTSLGPSHQVTWCWDADGNEHVLYGNDTAGVGSLYDVFHSKRSGGSWGSSTLAFEVHRKFSQFAGNWCIVPGASGDTVHAWYPKGNTGSWSSRGGDSIARKTYSGGSFGAESVIHTGTNSRALGTPTAVRNANADFRVAFTEVTQSTTSSDRVALERYGHGDSGFVQWPAQNDSGIDRVVFLAHFDGADAATSTSDLSQWSHLHTPQFFGTAQLDTAQKKFGTASLLLDGAGDYLIIPRSRSNLNTSEWRFAQSDTIECFIRPNELGRTQYFISTRIGSTGTGFGISQNSSNTIRFVQFGGTGAADISTTTTVTTGQWYYVAVRQNAGVIELWLDGTLEASSASGISINEGGDLHIGKDPSIANSRDFNGWIDAVRWTKNELRTVSSVPTVAFPSD